MAITFIQPREYRQLKIIEREIKTRILRRQLPSPADILERQTEVIKNQLTQTIARGGFDAYSGIIADLAADYDPIDLAAAALKLFQEGYKEQVLIEKSSLAILVLNQVWYAYLSMPGAHKKFSRRILFAQLPKKQILKAVLLA